MSEHPFIFFSILGAQILISSFCSARAIRTYQESKYSKLWSLTWLIFSLTTSAVMVLLGSFLFLYYSFQ
jgi:hypothetical protein